MLCILQWYESQILVLLYHSCNTIAIVAPSVNLFKIFPEIMGYIFISCDPGETPKHYLLSNIDKPRTIGDIIAKTQLKHLFHSVWMTEFKENPYS